MNGIETTPIAPQLGAANSLRMRAEDSTMATAHSSAPYFPVDVTWRAVPASDGFYARYGKRAIDIAGALIGLVLAAPIIVLAAILIKLDSEGAVFYRQVRLGLKQKPFVFYKLRSMHNGAHASRHKILHLNEVDGPVFKMTNDPRITRVGRFIRKTSIDELPQLINVLRGDMSLVGPRPPLAEEVAKYEPWQRRRLDVKPGVSCLWQISGRSTLGFDEWMRLDMEYIRRMSFRLDLHILLRTIPAVLSGRGAF